MEQGALIVKPRLSLVSGAGGSGLGAQSQGAGATGVGVRRPGSKRGIFRVGIRCPGWGGKSGHQTLRWSQGPRGSGWSSWGSALGVGPGVRVSGSG